MAIFDRISKDDLKKHFTHYGWIYTVCPVYVGDPEGECQIACRNWFPEWPLDVMEVIFSLAIQMRTMLDPDFEPLFEVKITGPIDY